VQEGFFFCAPEKAARDEDAVAELDEGRRGKAGGRSVLALTEGSLQDRRQTAAGAVEGEAGDLGVDPPDVRVHQAG
jgi:hypothetical protein